jgi:hypothetical protein
MKTKLFVVLLSLGFVISFGHPLLAAKEPVSSIEVNIPEYEVEQKEGYDYVDIPGGDILLVDGNPRVPYYSVSLPYQEGYRVQDVVLTEISGLMTATGLNLPIVTMEPDFPSGSEPSSSQQTEWYPEEDYSWSAWINSDGSSTLLISIFPFYYNVNTTDVKFYRNYRFDIEYTFSNVEITALSTDKDVYEPGDKVTLDMRLNNSGETQDVVVSIIIKQYGSDEIVGGLPLRSLKNLVGDTSLSAEWDTDGTEPGDYYTEATLADTAGNMLDKKTVGFGVQVSEAPEKPTPTRTQEKPAPTSTTEKPAPTPTPEKQEEFPTLYYVIIGAIVVVAVIASVFVIRSRKTK